MIVQLVYMGLKLFLAKSITALKIFSFQSSENFDQRFCLRYTIEGSNHCVRKREVGLRLIVRLPQLR